ncbi:MAG: redoxin domain-containing protein [Armatimonadetes bacterium]|nr:redoxin domain-containing protein [Armatimonadota bacterium]
MPGTLRRLAIALATLALLVPLTSGAAAALKTGELAPAFTAKTVGGKKIALADYKGKSAVLLNFYANF